MAKAKYTFNESRKEWITLVWDGTYTQTGAKHRKRISSKKSSADLEKKVIAFKQALEEQKNVSFDNRTFYEYSIHWLEISKANREKNTRQMYKNVIEKHFSYLYDIPIAKIQHSHFQQVINIASDRPRTCEQIYITFRQIIKSAIRDHILPKSAFDDICTDISLPTKIKAEKRPLTAVEKQALKNVVLDEKKSAFIFIIYYCGLRRGEALALTKSDFDFENRLLYVTKNLIFVNGMPEIKSYPKTDNGIRKVPMPSEMINKIRPFIEESPDGCIFRSKGRDMMTQSSYNNMWKSIVLQLNIAIGYNPNSKKNKEEKQITDLTAHIFRHNYCTELCYRVPEISTKMIAKLMGDTEKMVLDVYSHIVEEKERPTDVIESVFS